MIERESRDGGMRRARQAARLAPRLENSLSAYAAAAAAAGVSLLALSLPAEAKIVYTPAHNQDSRQWQPCRSGFESQRSDRLFVL